MNLKDHITRWLEEKNKAKKQNRKFDRFKVFNLCSYPWILEANNKSEVMKYASKQA